MCVFYDVYLKVLKSDGSKVSLGADGSNDGSKAFLDADGSNDGSNASVGDDR